MKPLLLLLTFALAAFAAPVPKGKAPAVDLRDPDGKVLVSADDLVSYDWDTHTLTLQKDAKQKLMKAIGPAGRFEICLDGRAAFEIRHVSLFVNQSFDGPVIVSTSGEEQPATELRIQAAYPDDTFAKSGDKRQVKELKAALELAGKLSKAEKK